MATIDFTKVPAEVTITNTSAKRIKSVQYFKTNLTQALAPGDVLLVVANTSAELFYWLSKRDDELTVTAEAITEAVE